MGALEHPRLPAQLAEIVGKPIELFSARAEDDDNGRDHASPQGGPDFAPCKMNPSRPSAAVSGWLQSRLYSPIFTVIMLH